MNRFATIILIWAVFAPSQVFGDITDLKNKIEEVHQGIGSVDSFSDYLIDSVEIEELEVSELDSRQFASLRNFDSIIGEKLSKRVFDLLLSRNSQSVALMEALAGQVLEPQDTNLRTINRYNYLFEKTSALLGTKKLKEFDRFSESITKSNETSLLNKLAATQIANIVQDNMAGNDFNMALKWFARIPSAGRKVGWENQVLEILNGLMKNSDDISHSWPFDDDSTKDLLLEIENTEASKKVAEPLAKLFSWRVKDSVKSGNIKQARDYYERVLTIRPDPNPENLSLRKAIVKHANGLEGENFALGRVEEINSNNELDLKTKLFLFGKGYYGAEIRKLLLVFAVGISAILGSIYLWSKFQDDLDRREEKAELDAGNSPEPKKEKRKKSKSEPSDSSGMSLGQRQAFSQPSSSNRNSALSGGLGGGSVSREAPLEKEYTVGYSQQSSGEDEYSTLVAVFGLTDEASESELKNAYRKMLKVYHPDTSDLGPEEAKRKLDELKQVYNRIQEIRGSWFGGRHID